MENEMLLAELKEMKNDIKESRKENQDIRERMGRMEEKLDVVRGIQSTAELAKDTANKALQSAESAHHRLNEAKKDHDSSLTGLRQSLQTSLEDHKEDVKEDLGKMDTKIDRVNDKLDEHTKWLTRASIAALLMGCVTLFGYLFSFLTKTK